jgi:hypothetical protein
MEPTFEIRAEWAHVSYSESSALREVYGFAGSQGAVNLEGIRFCPRQGEPGPPDLHAPASTLQLLPMPRAMAASGLHVLCAASRYARNDTPLIFENVVLDLGAWIRHAREAWGYDKVVLCGWSGGGALALLYQAEAERPTITATPAGDPIDLSAAGLVAADAMIFQAAHVSRAQLLADWIDPSVLDENDPDRRDPELDLYDPRNPEPGRPTVADYLARFRERQLARLRRRTAWVKETLAAMRARGEARAERGFVTHRTMAEPRFLDATLDPNGRAPGSSYLGEPRLANSAPAGHGALLDPACLALAMVDRRHPGRRRALRRARDRALPGDRERRRRCRAAAAHRPDLPRRRQQRQDDAGDRGRHSLLRRPAGAARRGGARLPRVAGRPGLLD